MCKAQESTSVYESFHAFTGAREDAGNLESESKGTTPESKSIAREFTSVFVSLREFACVHGRYKRCHELQT